MDIMSIDEVRSSMYRIDALCNDGFYGYDMLFRIQDYLDDGGDYAAVAQLFDMSLYFPGLEDNTSNNNNAGNNAGGGNNNNNANPNNANNNPATKGAASEKFVKFLQGVFTGIMNVYKSTFNQTKTAVASAGEVIKIADNLNDQVLKLNNTASNNNNQDNNNTTDNNDDANFNLNTGNNNNNADEKSAISNIGKEDSVVIAILPFDKIVGAVKNAISQTDKSVQNKNFNVDINKLLQDSLPKVEKTKVTRQQAANTLKEQAKGYRKFAEAVNSFVKDRGTATQKLFSGVLKKLQNLGKNISKDDRAEAKTETEQGKTATKLVTAITEKFSRITGLITGNINTVAGPLLEKIDGNNVLGKMTNIFKFGKKSEKK